MVEVELIRVFEEERWESFLDRVGITSKRKWYSLVALELRDVALDRKVAEWFYLLVCSRAYAENPKKNGPKPDPKYTVVTEELNLSAIKKIAEERVLSVRAKNWDEFLREMSGMFLYEDEEFLSKDYKKLDPAELKAYFNEELAEYRIWINKNIELSEDWLEEIEYMSFLRGMLHEIAERLISLKVDVDFQELKEMDRQWQAYLLEHRDPDFHLDHDRSQEPSKHWWEWLDRLDTLSSSDRETL